MFLLCGRSRIPTGILEYSLLPFEMQDLPGHSACIAEKHVYRPVAAILRAH
jgi:hypothetical protein